MNKKIAIYILLIFAVFNSQAQPKSVKHHSGVIPGAENMQEYLPLLKNKNVGIFANQTSMVADMHIVDTLLKCGVKIKKIFGPEHGFRGTAGAGEHIKNDLDVKTGIEIVSLYGKHTKPTETDLKGLDILIFDIQDVGVRFYTYISSLEYFMEAALEFNIPLIILDRPNPNGFYIDGPVLEPKFKSFVGMQPIPVVYGMTIGEYANMIVSEDWISRMAVNAYKKNPSLLKIILCKNYDHNVKYELPVATSPNLQNMQSVYLYPSTCFFEGTVLSEGRGTDKPFQIFGHPTLPKHLYSFTPKPNKAARFSKCYNQKCYGWDLSGSVNQVLEETKSLVQVKYLIDAYKAFPGKDSFFLKNNFFNKLAGNDKLMAQIKAFTPESEIRESWKNDLDKFRKIRKKYLLYNDFE
ncbi:MAG: DUF1343 domain-containing protein [Ferruginibacter sp.]